MAIPHRVGLLWRDAPDARTAPGFGRFDATAAALAGAGMAPEPCIYAEEIEAEVEVQLRAVAAVLVWVNPIHDGRNRTRPDRSVRTII